MNIYIYILTHPVTEEIKYVGKTNNPKQRLFNHIHKTKKSGKKPYLYCWIKSLIDNSLLPKMSIVQVCDENNWEDAEKYWIKFYQWIGCDLCNMTNGGETSLGGVANVDIENKIESINKAIQALIDGKSQTEAEISNGLYKGFLGMLRKGKIPYLKNSGLNVPMPIFKRNWEHLKIHRFKKGRINPNKGKKLIH